MLKDDIKFILSRISDKSKIPIESLHLVGVTEKIIKSAMKQQKSAGLSKTTAIYNILKLWDKSSPIELPASQEEMVLLGYKKDNEHWTHDVANVSISEEDRLKYSFKVMEYYAINGLAKIEKKQKHADDSKV